MKVRRAVLDVMIAHAREAAPDECCGLLVGNDDQIDEAVRVRNIDAGPARYRVDPAEHVALIRRLRGTGRSIVGAYHSHPRSSAIPSLSDLEEAYYPDFVYAIVSVARPDRPECRAWRIREARPEEIAIEIKD